MKTKHLLAAFTASFLATAVYGPASAQDKPLTIGMAVAYSGWMEAYDGEGTKMANLWVERTNAAGGIMGRQIKVITADTKTDRVEGAKAGQSLVQDGAEILLVSGDYDFGAPAALQAQKAGLISVFLSAADPKAGVLGVGPYAFTTIPAAQVEGATIGDWGYEKKGLRTGYMITDETTEYTKSVCAGYKWNFETKGKIVGNDTYKGDDPVINSQVTRLADAIKSDKVDHLMLCATNPSASSVIRQIRAAGIDLPILMGTAMDGTYWLGAVPDLKDVFIPTQLIVHGDKREAVNDVTAAYKAKYGAEPATQYAYPIYAFLDMWKDAVTKVGSTDTAAVVAEMNTYKDHPTFMGPRSFTPKLHVQTDSPLLITSYADGKQNFVEEWRIGEPVPEAVLYRKAN